ncbi:unnamed protein product [Chondrus crispus]|uniref:Uncharacterized protein n=1 Tax=Chondrus crispus TaxID=2769 RepID=R7QN01_CHOCR|nr:unnamed protein product [Chondrus crispus]CDF39148.1 unnamed protein product [Chondrus crispus]|eukprot:XP_005719059.1 unnamed protein product [Chondrus crispus]
MTASVSAAAGTPPSIAPAPSQLSAVQEKLTAVEALLAGLRAENHRLQTALAVERASSDADELISLRRDVHVVRHRLSRALRVFDSLGLDTPSTDAPIEDFINDTFLEQLPQRVTASLNQRELLVSKPTEAPQKPTTDPSCNTELQPPPNLSRNDQSTPEKENPAEEPKQSPSPQTDASGVPETLQGSIPVFPQPPNDPASQARPLVADTSPTVECVRMLIGADSIAVSDDPARIKIDMSNPEKKRALSFWLSWKDDVICYTRESVEVEEDSCPMFLKEYSIEFEVGQAPNFLVLVMGAMFDFRVKPKSEPTLEDEAANDDDDDDDMRDDSQPTPS